MNDRKVAFITGAGRGIGRGVAIELASQGYDIAGNARSFDERDTAGGLFEVKGRIEEAGGEFLPVQGDISAVETHAAMAEKVVERFGRVDLLVNNAGVAPETRADMLETSEQSYDRVLSINLRGPFFLTQRIARLMIEQKKADPSFDPAIVFITSISASTTSTSRAEYCVSKAGLSMVAALFADRLAEYDINVYEVRPGIIRTDMTSSVEEKYDRFIDEGGIPQRRWGLPEDVGRAVAALAGGAFGYSTGLVIEVSGGMNIRRL